MGQAKLRGTFEDRKRQAIDRQICESQKREEYLRLNPPKRPSSATTTLAAVMAMANCFVYEPPTIMRRKVNGK